MYGRASFRRKELMLSRLIDFLFSRDEINSPTSCTPILGISHDSLDLRRSSQKCVRRECEDSLSERGTEDREDVRLETEQKC